MKVLVTSARLPHAVGLIRHLGEAGHEVYASDTFRTAPSASSASGPTPSSVSTTSRA